MENREIVEVIRPAVEQDIPRLNGIIAPPPPPPTAGIMGPIQRG